jgi:hypothetical protein
MTRTALFLCMGSTDFNALQPVAEYIKQAFNVRFLLLNSFLEAKEDPRTASLSESEVSFKTHDARTYARHKAFCRLPIGMPTYQIGLRRLALDNISHSIGFRINELFNDLKPNLLVSAVDQPVLVRHIITEAYRQNIPTAVVQHGFYEYALTPSRVENGLLSPTFSNRVSSLEKVKRRVAFRYGITEYTHPRVDILFTIGSFFANRIGRLRSEYPCSGHTELLTSGTPEFDSTVQAYNSTVTSVLFLSQQQYESGVWGWNKQERLMQCLASLDEETPVTVRPHPKDSKKKCVHSTTDSPCLTTTRSQPISESMISSSR